MRDGVEAGGVELDAVLAGEVEHQIRDLERLCRIARVILQPGEIVEDLQPQGHVV